MSKVAIEGNALGSGTFTIASPNTNSSYTLSLPENTGTIITQNSTPAFASTIGVGGATAAASGAGITFPATESASSDANTLDDYEEGTWTPQLQFGAANAGMVNVSQQASYTKIGRLVHVQFRFSFSTKGSSTGNATVTGLPFPASGSTVNEGYPAGVFTFEANGAVNIPVSPFVLAWSDSRLYLRANTGTSTGFINLSNTTFGATAEIWGSIVYRTAA
jgi:hypothetical protein